MIALEIDGLRAEGETLTAAKKQLRQLKKAQEEKTRPALVTCNIERSGEAVYRAPTDAELAAFQEAKKTAAKTKTPVPLINPTDADAERLQTILNERATERGKKNSCRPPTPRTVHRTTQAQFSRLSGEGSIYHTTECNIGGKPFKVRMKYGGFSEYNAADCVVILTDKPQKPLPLDQAAPAAPTAATPIEPPQNIPTRQAALALD